MFTGILSIPQGIFVGDDVVSAPLKVTFKCLVFGEDRGSAANLVESVFGPSLSTSLIGGVFSRSVTPIAEYVTESDTAELRRNPLFHEVHIAMRTMAPIVVKGGIFDYNRENEAYLWLRVADGAKVRVVTMKVTQDTTAWEIVDQVNSVL